MGARTAFIKQMLGEMMLEFFNLGSVCSNRSVRPDLQSLLSMHESVSGSVRPEPVEGQSRTFPNEAIVHHELCCHMLRQAQHERFPGWMSPLNSLDLHQSVNESVRPEPVEGQSRINADEAIMHHEVNCYMLRQAQHERFPGWMSFYNSVKQTVFAPIGNYL